MKKRAREWTFVTSHAQVLLWIARDPELRVADLADKVGISERATYTILNDLCEAGYLTRSREGRRSRYRLHPDARLRLSLLESRTLAELLALVGEPATQN